MSPNNKRNSSKLTSSSSSRTGRSNEVEWANKRKKQSTISSHFGSTACTPSSQERSNIDQGRTTTKSKTDKGISTTTPLFPLFQKNKDNNDEGDINKSFTDSSPNSTTMINIKSLPSHPNFKQALKLRQLLIGQIMIDRMTRDTSKTSESSCNIKTKIYPMTKDGSSWIIHVCNYYPCPSNHDFDIVWDEHPKERKSLGHIFGKPAFENRYSQSYGATYSYSSYKDGTALPVNHLFSVQDLLNKVNNITNQTNFGWGPYNGCLMNWYEPDHNIAAHADDEKSMQHNAPIFSVSWGGPRRFVVKPIIRKGATKNKLNNTTATIKSSGGTNGVAKATSTTATTGAKTTTTMDSADILIGDGDLIVMGGTLQRTHKHEVPPWRKTKDTFVPKRRINWTARSFLEQHVMKKNNYNTES